MIKIGILKEVDGEKEKSEKNRRKEVFKYEKNSSKKQLLFSTNFFHYHGEFFG